MRLSRLSGFDMRAAGTPAAPPSPPGGFGSDIRDWIRQPGGQTLTVPDGTYTAGSITVNRSATDGWLVLQAANPGMAVVDMSYPGKSLAGGLTAGGDLIFENSTPRVMFVGFKFVNGTVKTATYPTVSGTCQRVRFWYTDHSFPATVWAAEPGHPATAGAPSTQYHDAPRLVDPRYGSSYVSMYGCDLHDAGTGLFPRAGTSNLNMVGLDIYNLSDGGSSLDPNDIIHPDGIGMVGGNYHDITISDSYIHPGAGSGLNTGIIIQDASGAATNITMARLWVAHSGSTGGGINLVSDHSAYGVFGTMNDVHAWDNLNFDLAEVVDGVARTTPNWSPTRINFTGSGNTFGTAQTGTDPATAWRAAHPIGSWSTYFSGNWP